MIENKPVWAVICGNIRQEFEFYSVIAWLCEQRSKGYVNGIVFSTWHYEIDRIPHLREKLNFLDIKTVETVMPSEEAGKYLNMNFMRQGTQLLNGICAVPNDVFVLKCRTDFCMTLLKKTSEILMGKKEFTISNYGQIRFPLQYKIAVFEFSVSAPFIFNDTVYLGYKGDILKMLLFEDDYIRYSDFFWPDSIFFWNPFKNSFKIIQNFLFHINYWELKRYLDDPILTNSNIQIPQFLLSFFAFYFILIKCCFLKIGDTVEAVEIKNADITDILFKNNNSNILKTWATFMKSDRWIDAFIRGDIDQSENNIRFYQEILKVASHEYNLNPIFTQKDYEELARFGREAYGVEPARWLKLPPNSTFKTSHSRLNCKDAYEILFSEFAPDNTMLDELYNIAVKEKTDFYLSISKRIDKLTDWNRYVAELALLTSARSREPRILKYIAYNLLNRNFRLQNVESAKFVFERYKVGVAFYRPPYKADKLSAIYYYGKYVECENDLYIVTRFSVSLLAAYEIENDKRSFTPEEFREVMAYIVNAKVSEKCDDGILNMIRSLCEICDKCPLSKKTIAFLIKNNADVLSIVNKSFGFGGDAS